MPDIMPSQKYLVIVHKLLCKWHMKRAWKNKIPLAGPEEVQREIYKAIEVIMEEKRFVRIYREIQNAVS